MAFTNSRKVRIEWGDCDSAGIIFYPRYFAMFDASTAALFEAALGITKYQMFKTLPFSGFPLARTRARFLAPTRFGDDVVITSSITFGRSSFQVEHKLTRDDVLCAEGSETRVWIVRDEAGNMKSHPVPDEVLEKFKG